MDSVNIHSGNLQIPNLGGFKISCFATGVAKTKNLAICSHYCFPFFFISRSIPIDLKRGLVLTELILKSNSVLNLS